jgi:transcriptional regulator with XRE-family HTH domain
MLCYMAWNIEMIGGIGARLRAERERAGLSMRQLHQQLDEKLRPSLATLSRWENDLYTPGPSDVEVYLQGTGASATVVAELVQAAADLETSPWLATTMPDRERQARTLLKHERSARHITVNTPLIIPGLLQTARYTEAMMRSDGISEGEIEERVAIRHGRRHIFQGPDAAHGTFLIGEAALLGRVVGPREMVHQLRELIRASESPNVDLRVVPLSVGWHPGLSGQFVLLDGPDGVCASSDTQVSALFFRDKAVVDAYKKAAEGILGIAMSPATTAGLIEEQIDKLESTNDDDTTEVQPLAEVDVLRRE